MNRTRTEFYVGLFVIIGLLSTGYLTTRIGEFSFLPQNRYFVYGYFSSAAGLKPGARVEIAGVEIGNIEDITIDKERLVAKVIFGIDKDIELSEDSIASVRTSGIIGEKFMNIP